MNLSEGFLVVLKAPEDIMLSNPCYRGLDRTAPWSQEKFEQGFEDPLVFADYTNEEGLIRSLSLAREVLDRFAQIESPGAFEIIYARTRDSTSVPSSPSVPGLRFFGLDVAGYAPFYSIVADVPSDYQSDPRTKRLVDRLNEHGLFDSIEDAKAYSDAYRSKWLTDAEQSAVLHLWDVYLVE